LDRLSARVLEFGLPRFQKLSGDPRGSCSYAGTIIVGGVAEQKYVEKCASTIFRCFPEIGPEQWKGDAKTVFRALSSAPAVRVYTCTQKMEFEWDPKKARTNFRKHGVRFADAVLVLEDANALTMLDESSADEERWVTLGLDPIGRVLVVVYTRRDGRARIISARQATARERRTYEEGQ
jgi:uncharacterized DUF497 family protein